MSTVGSRGNSYDDALVESVIGLYETEPGSATEDSGGACRTLELASLESVDWWNHRRLLEPIGRILPGEAQATY